jgi:muconolactone delta-isomerase
MLFLLTNRTHKTLTPEQYGHLAALAKQFYAAVPAGVTIRGEWAAVDQSRNYTLIEAPDLETVQRMQAPFMPYVEMEIVPVVAFSGWTAS